MHTAPATLPRVPSTVLFDLDGTLLDSSRPVLAAWSAALTGMGLDPLPRDELHRVIGPPMQLVAPELLAERGRDDDAVDEVVARFRAAITELEVEQALAYAGVEDLLRRLVADDRRLAVVTSKPVQAARRVVPALGFADVFVAVHGPDEARPEAKRHTLASAMRVLGGVDPDDTVLVGDRHHDVEAGAANGIATIGVTWGGFGHRTELEDAGAAAVVDTVDELAALLGLGAWGEPVTGP
jgi:phosphoglycolate phosphatase